MSYSQNGEEAVILRIFADVPSGKFLDCGAADGKTFSNTRALAELGWSGVLCEPSLPALEALRALYGNDPKFTIIPQPVGLDPHPIQFFDTPDLVGTTSIEHRQKWIAAGVPYTDARSILQITILQICIQFGWDFDFINIDTEGSSANLFMALPFGRLKPKAICVEHDDRIVELSNFAREQGYEPRYTDGNNIIFERVR